MGSRMDELDASEHYTKEAEDPAPTLLHIIFDTNPIAWAYLSETLPLSKVIAALLIFINAHLAFNQANKVSVIASHVDRAQFLYPAPAQEHGASNGTTGSVDVDMKDAPTNGHSSEADDANFYRPFATIASSLTSALRRLLADTSPSSLRNPTTALAGALTLTLTHANKLMTELTPDLNNNPALVSGSTTAPLSAPVALHSRVLILSTSPASPHQYIPLMNAIFAAARLSIPIDVLALTPTSSTFLQQASSTTSGTFVTLEHPHGLVQTLFQAFLVSAPSRAYLIPATQSAVDFRAACFCHRKVVDVGYVCSICLSIFCEPPEGAICITCGTKLRLLDYGRKPVVTAIAKQKKRRKRLEGDGSGAATPIAGAK